MRFLISSLAALVFTLAALPATASAGTKVPEGFFSTNWNGEITTNGPPALHEAEWQRMKRSGVDSTRAVLRWDLAEPAKGQYDWTTSDALVSLAARNGVELLPIVIYAPEWARSIPHEGASPPKNPSDYAAFMTTLITRYGPSGTFWTEHPEVPKRPVRTWQIWNEPHLPFQFAVDEDKDEDYAKTYGKLLRSAYKAVKKADPRAKVVLAGLANRSYAYLNALYRRGKIKGSFDIAALHPYTAKPEGVVELTRRFRDTMKKYKDSKRKVWITELGLPASKGKIESKSDLQTNDKGMAKFISGSYRAVAKARSKSDTRVDRIYQYTWASVYCCEQFRFTGLLAYDNKETVTPKPAYDAYVSAAKSLGALPKATERAQQPPPPPAPVRQVPQGFVGVMADGPIWDSQLRPNRQLDSMVSAGVETVRVTADWRQIQPYKTEEDVPKDVRHRFRLEDGIPTDWNAFDAIVRLTASRGITLLPVIMYAPRWEAIRLNDDASPPKGYARYAKYAATLVKRYGPNGTFWAENPDIAPLPIRQWQIWNEPSTTFFWSVQPSEKRYVKLLRTARESIKAADPGARIVLAGLPNQSWKALDRLYKAGVGGLYDVGAIHPFTKHTGGVMTLIKRYRLVMKRGGDGDKPLLVTELSWPSAAGRTKVVYGFEVTEAGQARRVQTMLPLLAQNREALKIEGVYWYTWVTADKDLSYPFDFAGLSRVNKKGTRVVPKPAFEAFTNTALALEGCTAKSADARACAP
jgi:arabinogalactan endo-1,4-beta-galactosidase